MDRQSRSGRRCDGQPDCSRRVHNAPTQGTSAMDSQTGHAENEVLADPVTHPPEGRAEELGPPVEGPSRCHTRH
eukprot:8053556-Pyramimonas_sp.AAC.1